MFLRSGDKKLSISLKVCLLTCNLGHRCLDGVQVFLHIILGILLQGFKRPGICIVILVKTVECILILLGDLVTLSYLLCLVSCQLQLVLNLIGLLSLDDTTLTDKLGFQLHIELGNLLIGINSMYPVSTLETLGDNQVLELVKVQLQHHKSLPDGVLDNIEEIVISLMDHNRGTEWCQQDTEVCNAGDTHISSETSIVNLTLVDEFIDVPGVLPGSLK